MGGGGAAPQRDLYAETAGELQAKLDLAPQIYAAQAQYGPQYQAMQLAQLQDLMNGTPGGTSTTPVTTRATQAGWYDADGNLLSADRNAYAGATTHGGSGGGSAWGGDRAPMPAGAKWVGRGGTLRTSTTTTTEASPGLLALLKEWAPQLSEIDAANLTAQRTADINDVANLGGASRAAIDAADPETAKLIAMMTDSANSDLALGSQLTPEQQRQITNTTTGKAGANGWGYNAGDLARTAMATTDYAQNLQDKRRQYAAGITGLRSGYYGDAFNRVLGRPAGTSTQSWYNTAMSTLGNAGTPNFGSSIDANDLYSTNFNSRVSTANSNANNQAAMTGAGVSAGVGILAALI